LAKRSAITAPEKPAPITTNQKLVPLDLYPAKRCKQLLEAEA